MSSDVRFCGNCGEGLAEGAKFCGACGWKVPVAEANGDNAARAAEAAVAVQTVPSVPRNRQPEPPRPVEPSEPAEAPPTRKEAVQPADSAERDVSPTRPEPPLPPAAPREPDTFFGSALSWALVWLMAWLPVGVFMGYFWTTNYARNQDLYNSYGYTAVRWGHTIPGTAIAIAVAGVLAGLLAGGVLRWRIPQIASARRRVPVLLIWLVGWALTMGLPAADFIMGGHQSDDTLLGLMFVFAPVIAIIAAQVAVSGTVPKATKGQRLWVSIGWALAAIVGFVTFILVSEIL